MCVIYNNIIYKIYAEGTVSLLLDLMVALSHTCACAIGQAGLCEDAHGHGPLTWT